MKHDIKHPKNWPLLDDLHTYLWKRFPMDRFDFIGNGGESGPEYAGTTAPGDAMASFPAEGNKLLMFDDVKQAVQSFLGERLAA